jgi:hypothetical protein
MLSANELVRPLADQLSRDKHDWSVETLTGEQTTKARLSKLIGGKETPSLLFTASHGIGFPNSDVRQLPHQGALLCQDWPGPVAWRKPIPQDFYFAWDDIGEDAHLLGLVAFHFACYGAGTPRFDDFAHHALSQPAAIAPNAFVSRLAKRMLSHPKGGALAVISHVDRAWGYSFTWSGAGRQIQTFESTIKRLMDDHPAGSALEYFNERYAELASDLNAELQQIKYGRQYDDLALSGMWAAHNDARSYVLIGDPAVRLPIGDNISVPVERPVIEIVSTGKSGSAPAPPRPQSPADLGLLNESRQAQADLRSALVRFTEALGKSLDDLTSLDISTYVSDSMDEVKYENERFPGAQLRAVTRIRLAGETAVCVPETKGELDETLWQIGWSS